MPGSTPIYLFPYPSGPDPADGPNGIKNLADRVELVIHDQVIPPLDTRITNVERILIGVSNDGTGKVTFEKNIISKTAKSEFWQVKINDTCDVMNNLTCYGGGATKQLQIQSDKVGFFGVTSVRKNGTTLADLITQISSIDTQNALNDILACLRGFGFYT